VSVAAPRELGLARTRPRQWAPTLAAVCGLVLVAATAEIVIDAAVGHSALIPKSPAIAGWLRGIGEPLGYRVFLIALLLGSAAYAGLLAVAGSISKRWALVLIGAARSTPSSHTRSPPSG
jgi:hypothetical protein